MRDCYGCRNGSETVPVVRFQLMCTDASDSPGSCSNISRHAMVHDKAFLPIQYDIRGATSRSTEANVEEGLRSKTRT